MAHFPRSCTLGFWHQSTEFWCGWPIFALKACGHRGIMEAISGVFKTKERAEHTVKTIGAAGIAADKITLLTPGTAVQVDEELRFVPADTTEQPGMGKAMGALAGGAVGITGGSLLIALIPGGGPIPAVGLLGAAIVGAAGAAIGAAGGDKAEKATVEGIPDE